MDLISRWNFTALKGSVQPITTFSFSYRTSSVSNYDFSVPTWRYPFRLIPGGDSSVVLRAKKKASQPEPVLKPSIVEEVSHDNDDVEEDQLLFDDFDSDEALAGGDDGDFGDEWLEEEEDEAELYVGDGAGGGGIALAGTWWDKEALAIAEEVCLCFDGELKIYAFKTLLNSTIRVRIERLTNKSGSPTVEDIEAFSTTYLSRLNEAELAKAIPDNISLEVSSPGIERVVRIPEELDRFKDRAMYVNYITQGASSDPASESDGVFNLISFDMEAQCCTWGLANVRINREKSGKGRPLSKKQRGWRLTTPFDSLRLVRLYSDI